jgi:hypothetical protein
MASGDLAQYAIQWQVADIGGTAVSLYVVPLDGRIIRVESVLWGAISTANAVLSFTIGGVQVNGSQITIAFSGSALGDRDFANLTGLHTTQQVKQGDILTVASNGGPSDSAAASGHILIDRS